MIKQIIDWIIAMADRHIEDMGHKDLYPQDVVNAKVEEMLKPHLSIEEQVEEVRKAVRSDLKLK